MNKKQFSTMGSFLGRIVLVVFSLLLLSFFSPPLTAETWIINSRVEVTAPRDVEDVLVTEGGHLIVSGVGEPGFRISGNFVVEKTGQAELRDSVIIVMSRYRPGELGGGRSPSSSIGDDHGLDQQAFL
ncbi:MAG: hypothetical protein WCB96_05130 [Candidatus Aminicenantales bacterium]